MKDFFLEQQKEKSAIVEVFDLLDFHLHGPVQCLSHSFLTKHRDSAGWKLMSCCWDAEPDPSVLEFQTCMTSSSMSAPLQHFFLPLPPLLFYKKIFVNKDALILLLRISSLRSRRVQVRLGNVQQQLHRWPQPAEPGSF